VALDISRLKIYVAPLLLIAGALAVLIVVIMPTLTQIAATREELTVLDDRRAKLAVKAGILGTVTEPGLRSDIAVAEISLPTDKSVSGMIFGLETMAASAGATLTAFSTEVGKISTSEATIASESGEIVKQELDLPNGVKNIEVEAKFLGSYDAIQTFLAQLNSVNRLLGVDKVEIDKENGKVILMVFYQPQLETLGDITSPVEDITAADRNYLRQVASFTRATPELQNLPTGKLNPFQ